MQISFAITSWQRTAMVLQCFEQILLDPRIGEIIISDDFSDLEVYQWLCKATSGMDKVKLSRNSANLDCYQNKRAAILKSSFDWCILADSDNIFGKDYIDKIFELQTWEQDTIYAPFHAKPQFDYSNYAGMTLTKENVAAIIDKPLLSTALNTANYFVNRKFFLNVWDGGMNPVTADTLFHNYNHLAAGGKIKIVGGLSYYHLVHAGSHYKNNVHRTNGFDLYVEQQIRELK